MSVRQSCSRQLVEGVQHTGYIVRVLVSGSSEKDAPARRLPAYFRSSPMQTRHTRQGDVSFQRVDGALHTEQARGRLANVFVELEPSTSQRTLPKYRFLR
jgi:hypothetical protein